MAYTRLEKGAASFDTMMKGFGVVTVMNADIYEIPEKSEDGFKGFDQYTAEDLREHILNGKTFKKLATIDTLKVANITIEGPTKSVTGGQYTNPLIKFGKTARLEMQDALGRADAIDAFGGAIAQFNLEGEEGDKKELITGMHVTSDFAPIRLIIGKSFFISKESGQQEYVDIMFYQVSPDSIFNLTQDAEGDATVFDMNADLLTTDILVPHKDNKAYKHGVFYSILPEYVKSAN